MRDLNELIDVDLTLGEFWKYISSQLIRKVVNANDLVLRMSPSRAIHFLSQVLYKEREAQLSGKETSPPFGERRYVSPFTDVVEYRWQSLVWNNVEDTIGDCVFEIAEELAMGMGYHLEDELLELCPSVITDTLWILVDRTIPEHLLEDDIGSEDEPTEDPTELSDRRNPTI